MPTLQDATQEFFKALKASSSEGTQGTTFNPAGGTTQSTTSTPTNAPAPQIYTAQEAVRALSNHIQHPCTINHDAATTGVRHASLVVHPEWNQDHVKDQANEFLTGSGFKGKKAGDYTGKTYEHPQTGSKVHVASVGKHLVITSDDKKGTRPTQYTPPVLPDDGKNTKGRGK